MMLTANQLKALKKMMPRDTKKNRTFRVTNRFFQIHVKNNVAYASNSHIALAIPTDIEDQNILANDHPEILEVGKYPDIASIFQTVKRSDPKVKLAVSLKELKRVTELALLLKEPRNKVNLQISISDVYSVKVKAQRKDQTTPELETYEDALVCGHLLTGPPQTEIWLDAEYVNDVCIAFNHLKADTLTFVISDPLRPVYVHDGNGNSVILSPVRYD